MKTKIYILQVRQVNSGWSEKFRTENFDDIRTLHAAAEILKRLKREGMADAEARVIERVDKVILET